MKQMPRKAWEKRAMCFDVSNMHRCVPTDFCRAKLAFRFDPCSNLSEINKHTKTSQQNPEIMSLFKYILLSHTASLCVAHLVATKGAIIVPEVFLFVYLSLTLLFCLPFFLYQSLSIFSTFPSPSLVFL